MNFGSGFWLLDESSFEKEIGQASDSVKAYFFTMSNSFTAWTRQYFFIVRQLQVA